MNSLPLFEPNPFNFYNPNPQQQFWQDMRGKPVLKAALPQCAPVIPHVLLSYTMLTTHEAQSSTIHTRIHIRIHPNITTHRRNHTPLRYHTCDTAVDATVSSTSKHSDLRAMNLSVLYLLSCHLRIGRSSQPSSAAFQKRQGDALKHCSI